MTVKRLKNGLRVHLVPMKGTAAATVLVLTKVGSRYEDDRVWGASHFIEHLMFKGTKRRPKTIDISKTLDRYGAEFNAYTGKDITGYYVKIAGEKLPIAIDLLHDMLFHSLYSPAEMKREKGVIIEEIKMYEENPIMHVADLVEMALFDGNPLGREIAGSPENMRTMKRSDVLAYRDEHYAPSEIVIVVAGNITKDIFSDLERTFGTVKKDGAPRTIIPYSRKTKSIRIKRQYKSLKQIQIALGFEMPGKDDKDIPAIKLLAGILGGNMSSRLFTEVRERRGLCYTIRASAEEYEDVGIFSVKAGLDASRLTQAMNIIFAELKKITKNGVTQKELRYIKDHIFGATVLGLEDSSVYAEFFARQELFFGKTESPQERLAKFAKVTRADIKRVACNVLTFDSFAVAAIGPYETDAELLKHFPLMKNV